MSWAPDQPWHDVRARRALSMSLDRDTFANVIFDPGRFKDVGVDLDIFWNTPLGAGWGEYWLNPKSNEFGPSAQYLMHNVAESRKLLDAAGYTAQQPLEIDVVFPSTYYGRDWPTRVETFQAMAAEAGIRMHPATIDYTAYIAGYWRGGAMFGGVNRPEAVQFPPGGAAASTALEWCISYFTPTGVSTAVADAWPEMDTMVKSLRQVTDFEEQKAGIHDIQRFAVENMVVVPIGPITQSVDLIWDALHGPGEIQGWPGGFPDATNYYEYWMEEQI